MKIAGDTAEAFDASQQSGKPSPAGMAASTAASSGVPAQASKGIDQGTSKDINHNYINGYNIASMLW